MLVAPERRMSSCVITKIAAAASATFCVRLETENTCVFIRSSRLIAVTSGLRYYPQGHLRGNRLREYAQHSAPVRSCCCDGTAYLVSLLEAGQQGWRGISNSGHCRTH